MTTAAILLLATGATCLMFGFFDRLLARNRQSGPRQGAPADRRQEAERAIKNLRRSSPYMIVGGSALSTVGLLLVLIVAVT